jgi:hypothetical protein
MDNPLPEDWDYFFELVKKEKCQTIRGIYYPYCVDEYDLTINSVELDRIQKFIKQHYSIELTPEQACIFWEDHSSDMDASFLIVEEYTRKPVLIAFYEFVKKWTSELSLPKGRGF